MDRFWILLLLRWRIEDLNANWIIRIDNLSVFRRNSDILELPNSIGWPLQPEENQHWWFRAWEHRRWEAKTDGPWTLSPYPRDRSRTQRNDLRMWNYFQSMPQEVCLSLETAKDYGFNASTLGTLANDAPLPEAIRSPNNSTHTRCLLQDTVRIMRL